MTPTEILADLTSRGVQVSVQGDDLRCRGPRGVLTDDLRATLAEHKADLLAAVRERTASERAVRRQRVVPDPASRFEPFPLSELQQAFWVGRRGDGYQLGNVGSLAYVEIETSRLDVDRLSRAMQRLIERHEMVRCVVQSDGREQRILPKVPPYEVEVIDLCGEDRATAERALDDVRVRLSSEVFQPDQWPMFRICAVRLDAERTRLYLVLDLIIADALSGHILARDLARLYADPETAFPHLELSYRDYVLARTKESGSPAHQRALEYWRERLPTLPAAPDMPLATSPTGPAYPRFVPLKAQALDAAAWRRLKEAAAVNGVTPAGVLLAAFADVVAVWSRRARFTLNAPFPNRLPLHPQVRDVVGNFTSVNFVAVDADPGESFRTRARRLHEQTWEGLEHSRHVSGVQVLRELQRMQGGSAGTIMPIVFTSAFLHEGGLPMAALGQVIYDLTQTPQMCLEVRVVEENSALAFTWNAMEGLFPPDLLESMLDANCRAVRHLAADPAHWDESSREYLVPVADRALGEAINATDGPICDDLLHDAFAAQAHARPEAIAVITGEVRLRYAELESRANRLAHELRARGARPNQLVAVVMEKGWEQIVAVLGILKAGAAYLPLDPSLPPARLAHLLANGEVRLALTQPQVDGSLEWPLDVERVVVDETALTGDDRPLPRAQGADDLAYVIYTSGSTGMPKGVMITHRGAVNTIRDINRRFALTPEDRVLAASSLTFDLSVWDVFGSLAAGATIVMPDAGGTREPAHWAALMLRERVTVWNSVPALMQMLLERGGRLEALPSSLRLAMLSGDWIPPRMPSRIRQLVPQAQIVSLGGATEASIWSVVYPVGEVPPHWKSIPYGKPMTNQRIFVLNEALETRPIWVPGELYLGGLGLASGYWRDEERTRVSFVTHPRTGERLYRTGDWGRYLPDGNVELLGREDLQVKIRGHRIELCEIESALQQHPGVRAAVVMAIGSAPTEKRLVGYVVPEDGAALSASSLRRFLRERLADYMIPADFHMLEALPLTSNGKVDRNTLPAAPPSSRDQGDGFVAPRNPVEQQLARIWGQVLDAQNVGVHDDFFERLGGDSLQATQIVARVCETYQVDLLLQDLFDASTIAGLALVVEEALVGQIEDLTGRERESCVERSDAATVGASQSGC